MFKLALLTGGSSGIGFAVARALVIKGSSVILIARRTGPLAEAKTALEQLASEAGFESVKIKTLALDVSDSEAVNRTLLPFLEETGTPDLLFNGAGMAYPDHFESIPLEIFQKTMDINLGGTWNILSALIPLMKAAGGGTVVNVSSMAGLVGTYGYTAYAASKFALVGMSQSLRNEMKPERIDVRVLCPPDTDTPQLAEEEKTKPAETRKISGNAGVMVPEVVARVLLKELKGRKFLIIPGFMGKLTWFLYRMFPSLVHFLIDSDVRSIRNK